MFSLLVSWLLELLPKKFGHIKQCFVKVRHQLMMLENSGWEHTVKK